MKPAVPACLTLLLFCGCREEPLEFGPAAILDVAVLDDLQSPVVQARVEARNRDNVLRAAEQTDQQGEVHFSLVPGTYTITVEPPEGYARPDARQVELIVNQPARSDYQINNLQPAVAGEIRFGFEVSAFLGCGEPTAWLEGPASGAVHRAHAELRRQGTHGVWLAGRARVREGRFGHLGAYPRLVEVTHIEDLRARRASDCPKRSLSVEPHNTYLAVGDTMRIDLAVFDAQGRQIEADRVSWSSSNSAVATVDASGLVRVLSRAPVRIVATRDNVADTTHISVVQPWVPEGYGKVEGELRNADGSVAPGIALNVSCAGSFVETTSDPQGRFAAPVEAQLGNSVYLSDDRLAMCVARTDPRVSGDAAFILLPVRYSRPGRAAPISQITMIRKPRGARLVLSASAQSLRVGEGVVINTQTFTPADLVFRSLLPEVATVDETGRVTARAPGSVLIAAHSRADTTRIGWLEIWVNR